MTTTNNDQEIKLDGGRQKEGGGDESRERESKTNISCLTTPPSTMLMSRGMVESEPVMPRYQKVKSYTTLRTPLPLFVTGEMSGRRVNITRNCNLVMRKGCGVRGEEEGEEEEEEEEEEEDVREKEEADEVVVEGNREPGEKSNEIGKDIASPCGHLLRTMNEAGKKLMIGVTIYDTKKFVHHHDEE